MIENSQVGSILGAPVKGPEDEKVGTVGQIFVDPRTNTPNWATVHTGLFGRHETFVPLDQATWDREVLHVPFDKSTIKDAPRIDTDEALTTDGEAELYRYYGITPDVDDVSPVDDTSSEQTSGGASRHDDSGQADADAAAAGAAYSRQSRMEKYRTDSDAGVHPAADPDAGGHPPADPDAGVHPPTDPDAASEAPRKDGPKHRA